MFSLKKMSSIRDLILSMLFENFNIKIKIGKKKPLILILLRSLVHFLFHSIFFDPAFN